MGAMTVTKKKERASKGASEAKWRTSEGVGRASEEASWASERARKEGGCKKKMNIMKDLDREGFGWSIKGRASINSEWHYFSRC